jgi:hypothetical protein
MNAATDTSFSYARNFTCPGIAKPAPWRSPAEKTLSSGNLPALRRARMRLIFLTLCCVVVSAAQVRAASLGASESCFYYKETSGKTGSARIIRRYWRVPIVHPFAKVDPRIDPKLRRAATIAEERANAQSKARCWHYVKHALVAAGVINSYPKTAYAAEAGLELVRDYGFRKLSVRDPYNAPLGAVLVYGDRTRGHVEIRTKDGFASDYHSKNRCFYPLLAVYGKFSS